MSIITLLARERWRSVTLEKVASWLDVVAFRERLPLSVLIYFLVVAKPFPQAQIITHSPEQYPWDVSTSTMIPDSPCSSP